MKQAICIQCHNKPEQINEIIKVFPSDRFDFFIHVDKKSSIINEIVKQDNVKFVTERIDIRWGRGTLQVESTLRLFDLIDGNQYNYVHLISGNDFPIKSPEYIWNTLLNSDIQYIEANELPRESTWSWHGQDRYQVWYPQWMVHRSTDKFYRMIRVCYREFIMRTKIFKRRKFPVDKFYGGSAWFSLTGECVEWIKMYMSKHPSYLKFFKHGLCSDELFFATLLMNSPFKDKIAGDSYRFMLWKGSKHGSPFDLKAKDIPAMKDSKYLFARKFTDLDTLKLVEKKIIRCEVNL